MKRILLFDADGTLFDYTAAEKSALTQTFRHFGHSDDVEELISGYKIINNDLWKAFEIGIITLKDLRVKRFIKLIKDFDLNADPEKFAKQYVHFLSQCAFLLPETMSVLKELEGKYRLALITNGIAEVQKSRLKISGLDHFFPEVIISEEAGRPKPEQKFFDYTFQRLGFPQKEDCLVIGDSLTSDIAGGNGYDIDTCWFNPDKIENTTEFKPTWEIEKLGDVVKIIEQGIDK